ncbi:hypothetical protein A2U01_0090806, partial [Trifolium medium]|nr:hypothetical protein [Trifolium medium]
TSLHGDSPYPSFTSTVTVSNLAIKII